MKLKIKQGTTSKLARVFVQDSSATDGSGLTGLAYNTASLTAYYIREGDSASTAITLTTGTTGTWSSGAWSEVDSTYMPGVYEIGLPDAVVDATSEGSVVLMLRGASNMAPVLIEIELDAVAYRDATSFGLSRLDAAVSSRSDLAQADVRTAVGLASANLDTQLGNVPTVSEFEARTILAANYSTFDYTSNQVTVSTNNDKTGYELSSSPPTTSQIADAVWDESQSGHTTVGSFGYYLDAQVSGAGGGSAPTVSQIADGVWDELQSGHTTVGTFGYYVDAQISGAGSGGSGLYQVTVRVEDSSNDALQGARVNVDGTTLTLTTTMTGEVVFNLDAGTYTLNVSPPAGYSTPAGQSVTVTSSDVTETFTLTGTGTCDAGWLG